MIDTQCAHCATPIPEDARFCHACGSSVSDAEGQAAATAAMDNSAFLHMETMLREETEGEFKVEGALGRGGMAVVYLATEVHLSRKVAIKVLPPELTFGHGVERFKREAKTAAALDHPNIIPIYRIASGGKLFWYAMKYLEGQSLDERLKEQDRYDPKEAIDILRQVADALDYAHEHQVIHRDIKPANVMLDSRGRVVVTDFGIAKALTEGTLTASGSVIGTPYFMSPEQGMGKPVTGASDQYSVGVMAYRMLSGKVPFEGDSAIDILHKHCMVPPPPMETVRADLPKHIYLAVHRALEKSPERRFATVTELVEALRRPSLQATGQVGDRSMEADVATVVLQAQPDHSMAVTGGASIAEGATTPIPPYATAPGTAGGASVVGAPPAPPKSKKWIGVAAAAVIVLGGGGFWALSQGGSEGPTTQVPAESTGVSGPVAVVDTGGAQPAAAGGDTTQTPPVGAVVDTPTQPAARPPETPPVVTRQPARPTTGDLIIQGLPSDASLTIDGQPRSGTSFRLSPGRYMVAMRAPGYDLQRTRVEVVAGRSIVVPFTAARLQQQPTPRPQQPVASGTATLVFQITPAADVSVDGAPLGELRQTEHTVRAGVAHLIRISRDGYVTKDTTVNPTAGETLRIRIRLEERR